ncbi:MAG: hypothetical protein E7604_06615 [Ruminococcaceae bacterium]|nr:hypothetical protein [Oscillospiraceae bacterium]
MNWMRLLAVLLCAFLLTACTEPEAVTEETEPPTPAYVNITSAGASDYYVIRSDATNDRSEINAAVKVRTTINDATGAEIGISTDWEKNPVYDHEIIVGNTLRDGLEIDITSLGETGYIIKEVDGDIYICGGASAGIRMAVDYFLQEFVKDGQDVAVPTGYEHIVYHQFDIPALYIDMNRVDKNWKIVIPEKAYSKEKQAAEALQETIARKCGFLLDIITGDENVPNAFILSDVKPEMNGLHTMHIDGTSFIFRSSAGTGIAGCTQRFIDLYFSRGTRGKFNFPGDFEYLDLGDLMMVTYPDTK